MQDCVSCLASYHSRPHPTNRLITASILVRDRTCHTSRLQNPSLQPHQQLPLHTNSLVQTRKIAAETDEKATIRP